MMSRDPERILLIRPSALGDVARSVPILASLRKRFPNATIDWLVQDTFADAIKHHPALNSAIPFPRRSLGKASGRGNILPAIRWMNQNLRSKRRYDLVVDAQGLFRSGLFARWTGAPFRVGFANASEGAAVFYTRGVSVDRSRHAVDRMLALLPAAGVEPIDDMRLYADPLAQAWQKQQPFGAREYIVLAPTSRWPAKQWPDTRFAELARLLLARTSHDIVIVGGPGERDQCPALLELASSTSRVHDHLGNTTVAMLMAIIEKSSLVAANDSAATHIAVGFDRPLVALFGPTDVAKVGPYKRETDVIQSITAQDTLLHKNNANAVLMHRIGVVEVLNESLLRLR